jgi:hypothetical protein
MAILCSCTLASVLGQQTTCKRVTGRATPAHANPACSRTLHLHLRAANRARPPRLPALPGRAAALRAGDMQPHRRLVVQPGRGATRKSSLINWRHHAGHMGSAALAHAGPCRRHCGRWWRSCNPRMSLSTLGSGARATLWGCAGDAFLARCGVAGQHRSCGASVSAFAGRGWPFSCCCAGGQVASAGGGRSAGGGGAGRARHLAHNHRLARTAAGWQARPCRWHHPLMQLCVDQHLERSGASNKTAYSHVQTFHCFGCSAVVPLVGVESRVWASLAGTTMPSRCSSRPPRAGGCWMPTPSPARCPGGPTARCGTRATFKVRFDASALPLVGRRSKQLEEGWRCALVAAPRLAAVWVGRLG